MLARRAAQADAFRSWMLVGMVSAALHLSIGGVAYCFMLYGGWLIGPHVPPPPSGKNSIALVASAADLRADSSELSELVAPSASLHRPVNDEPIDAKLSEIASGAKSPDKIVYEPQIGPATLRGEKNDSPLAVTLPSPRIEVRIDELDREIPVAKAEGQTNSVASPGSAASEGADIDELPQQVNSPAPIYPADALRAGQSGQVVLDIAISAEGIVLSVHIYRTSGVAALDAAAQNAVERWQFTPAKRNGLNVACRRHVPINFVLPMK